MMPLGFVDQVMSLTKISHEVCIVYQLLDQWSKLAAKHTTDADTIVSWFG